MTVTVRSGEWSVAPAGKTGNNRNTKQVKITADFLGMSPPFGARNGVRTRSEQAKEKSRPGGRGARLQTAKNLLDTTARVCDRHHRCRLSTNRPEDGRTEW